MTIEYKIIVPLTHITHDPNNFATHNTSRLSLDRGNLKNVNITYIQKSDPSYMYSCRAQD